MDGCATEREMCRQRWRRDEEEEGRNKKRGKQGGLSMWMVYIDKPCLGLNTPE